MAITIKRVSECSIQQLTDTWNEGFSDYFANMTFTVEMFTNWFANEDLYPTQSVVAFIDDKPVGMILNGFRMIQGKKVAWNGGTCVIPSARRYGVGKAMMDAILKIYQEEGVSVATLEAYRHNEREIALYVAEHPIARCASLNTRESDDWLIQVLEESGFSTRKEQVYMVAEL